MSTDEYLDDRGWSRHLFWLGIMIGLLGIGWFVRGILTARGNPDATLHNPKIAERALSSGYTYIHFDRLRGVDPGSDSGVVRSVFKGIPDDMLPYDGQRVCLEGYANPLGIENGKLTRFLLYRHLSSCCFGVPAQRNEWVEVINITPEARSVNIRTGDGIAVYGTFSVGERKASDGQTSIYYSLKCDKVEMIVPF